MFKYLQKMIKNVEPTSVSNYFNSLTDVGSNFPHQWSWNQPR